MKKEIFLKNLLPIVLIFIMGGVFVISSKVYYRQTMIEQISNDLYKKDVTHCMQKGKIQLSQMIDICDNTFLSKILDEKGMYNNVRGIYFSSNYSYCLPVIEGRFFHSSDFKKENNYVVVGQNWKSKLYVKQNKSYYKYLGKEYEVIGIVGFDIPSKLDDVVFFNLVNVFEEIPENTKIVMGESFNKVNQNLEQLQLKDTMDVLDIPDTGISRIWSIPNIYSFLVSVTYFSCMVGVLFTIYLKSYYYNNLVKVFKMLGFRNRFIYWKISVLEAIFYIIAFAVGAMIAYTFIMNDFSFYQEFFYSIIGYAIISCIIMIGFNFMVLERKVKKFIKGGEKYDFL